MWIGLSKFVHVHENNGLNVYETCQLTLKNMMLTHISQYH